MIARAEVMTWGPGAHGSTYGGNPVSLAALMETDPPARGRPHRQRRHPRPRDHGRPPAARGPVPGPRQGRPRQGPDDRGPVRLRRDRRRGPDAGVRPRPARPRGRRRLRPDVPAAGRVPGRGRDRGPDLHRGRRARRRSPGRRTSPSARRPRAPGMPPRVRRLGTGFAPRRLHSGDDRSGAEAHARQGRLDARRHRGPRPRRGHGRDRGVHAPDRLLRGPRDHPPAQARPHPRAHDAGPHLRPDDRRRRRPQADLLLARATRASAASTRSAGGSSPRRWGRGRRSRSRSTATSAWCRATRPAPPTCRSCRCAPTSRRTCRRRTR